MRANLFMGYRISLYLYTEYLLEYRIPSERETNVQKERGQKVRHNMAVGINASRTNSDHFCIREYINCVEQLW